MRTTIYIDEGINVRLRQFVPRRGLNRFVNAALAEKVAMLEHEQLERALKEGYLATRAARAALNDDWAGLDSADWPA